METIPDDFEWMTPWHPISAKDSSLLLSLGVLCPTEPDDEVVSRVLEDELRGELPEGHILSGVQVKAIGYCCADHNEFLFLTDQPSHPIACVHLTWEKERDSLFPHTDLYASEEDWTAQMQREHEGAGKQRAEQD